MNLSTLIEVAIGVMFVWILLAAITSQIQDWLSQILKWRANMLEESIENILVDDDLTKQFYTHPLIKGLHSEGGQRKPAAIPNKQFASVIFDMLLKAGTEESVVAKNKDNVEAKINDAKGMINQAADTIEQVKKTSVYARLREKIDTFKQIPATDPPEPGNKKKTNSNDFRDISIVLDTLWVDIEDADQDIGEARKRLESWFDDAMTRLGGAYKRKMQGWALIIGIILALLLNADSLAIANSLWTDPAVREALVAQAQQLNLQDLGVPTATPQPGNIQPTPEPGSTEATPAPQTDSQQAAAQNLAKLQSLSIPIGWTSENIPARGDVNGWVMKFGGILLSGIAAAQGAPFWFEIVRKLLNFRSGGGGGGGSASASPSEPAKKDDGPVG